MTGSVLYVCVRPQQDAAAAEYESFRTAMQLERDAIDHHDLVRNPLPHDVFDRYQAFVVGGSPFNVADPEPTKTEPQVRLERDLEHLAAHAGAGDGPAALFTCYGIGVVTRMLGGDVTRAFPEDTGPTMIELTDAAQTDPLFGGLANRFSALTAHKEGTASAPAGSVLLASNDACPVQAYRVGERLYTTQFHPEPTPVAFTERMVVYRNDGYFDATAFDETAARVLSAKVTEPVRLLRAFARRFGSA
ncbi:GMP synthase [Microbacterium sp. C7(2022)]|uniref:glutamine amidotransferase-related protein n=1 Tax=Microbacterium sp. C7(2022) TaxID=2992759 RepID=UPI00237BA083|nr:GMP synthase [Microbacterium sp. C7(2022)]MDE0545245.1 GMP synthase [Microbacterium sp. C7(2022)]